jgi:hypothetical protein
LLFQAAAEGPAASFQLAYQTREDLQVPPMAIKSNDKWLGVMTLILLGTTFTTAFYGYKSSQNGRIAREAETELENVAADLKKKQNDLTDRDILIARKERELDGMKSQLDETSLNLQKLNEMLARKRNGAAETDPADQQDLEIAQRNLKDLQRRNQEYAALIADLQQSLGANSKDELLALVDQMANRQQAADKIPRLDQAKAEADSKKLVETNERKANANKSNAQLARDAYERRLASQNQTPENPVPENPVPANPNSDGLEVVTKNPQGVGAWPGNESLKPVMEGEFDDRATARIKELEATLAEVNYKLERRERLLAEQAELIERVKHGRVVAKPALSDDGQVIRVEYPDGFAPTNTSFRSN